jgi:hypothetical protein
MTSKKDMVITPAGELLSALQALAAATKAAAMVKVPAEKVSAWADQIRGDTLLGEAVGAHRPNTGGGIEEREAFAAAMGYIKNIAALPASIGASEKQAVIDFMFEHPNLVSTALRHETFLAKLGYDIGEDGSLPDIAIDLQGIPFKPSAGIPATLKGLNIPHVTLKISGDVDGIVMESAGKKNPTMIKAIVSDADLSFTNCSFGETAIDQIQATGEVQFGNGCKFGGMMKGVTSIRSISATRVIYGELAPDANDSQVSFRQLAVEEIKAAELYLSPKATYTAIGKKVPGQKMFASAPQTTPAIPSLHNVGTLGGIGRFFETSYRDVSREGGKLIIGDPRTVQGAIIASPQPMVWVNSSKTPERLSTVPAVVTAMLDGAGGINQQIIRDAQRRKGMHAKKIAQNASACCLLDGAGVALNALHNELPDGLDETAVLFNIRQINDERTARAFMNGNEAFLLEHNGNPAPRLPAIRQQDGVAAGATQFTF